MLRACAWLCLVLIAFDCTRKNGQPVHNTPERAFELKLVWLLVVVLERKIKWLCFSSGKTEELVI